MQDCRSTVGLFAPFLFGEVPEGFFDCASRPEIVKAISGKTSSGRSAQNDRRKSAIKS